MEWWNDGIMGYKIKILSPIFHYSNMPVPYFLAAHYSIIPSFHSSVLSIYSHKKVEIHYLNP